MSSEFLRQLGPLVLDHRFRRMVETLVQTAEDIYERLGIPFRARWASTYLLLETDAPIGITAIADRIGLTHPAAIGLTNDMMAAGLVEEVADAADQRRRMLRLSAAGRRLGPRLHAIWDALAAAQRARFKTAGCDIVAVLNKGRLIHHGDREKLQRGRSLEAALEKLYVEGRAA